QRRRPTAWPATASPSCARARCRPPGIARCARPADVAALLTPLIADLDRETFLVAALDGRNRLAGINTVSIGSGNVTLVHPREVFKPAILLNAAAIIVAHNHPSGDPTPSPE